MDLHVTVWGEQGPPVLLIHGSIFAAEATWSAQRPLGECWRVLVPDRRGFGKSLRADREDYLVDADDLIQLLEGVAGPARSLERSPEGSAQALKTPGGGAHLVGHSYGGVVAMLMAGSRPDLARSVTIIEAPVYQVSAPERPEVAAYLEQSRTRQDEEKDPKAFLRRFMGERPAGYSAEMIEGARLMLGQRRPWEAALPLDFLKEQPLPKLVVSGGHSPIHEATCDVLAERLGAQRAVLPGRGHAAQRAPGFNDRLEAFLREAH